MGPRLVLFYVCVFKYVYYLYRSVVFDVVCLNMFSAFGGPVIDSCFRAGIEGDPNGVVPGAPQSGPDTFAGQKQKTTGKN